jgi:hypothetical protein
VYLEKLNQHTSNSRRKAAVLFRDGNVWVTIQPTLDTGGINDHPTHFHPLHFPTRSLVDAGRLPARRTDGDGFARAHIHGDIHFHDSTDCHEDAHAHTDGHAAANDDCSADQHVITYSNIAGDKPILCGSRISPL